MPRRKEPQLSGVTFGRAVDRLGHVWSPGRRVWEGHRPYTPASTRSRASGPDQPNWAATRTSPGLPLLHCCSLERWGSCVGLALRGSTPRPREQP
jgi:hypothetical protein